MNYSKLALLILIALGTVAEAGQKPTGVPQAYQQRTTLRLARPEQSGNMRLQRDSTGRVRRLMGILPAQTGRTWVEMAQMFLTQNQNLIQAGNTQGSLAAERQVISQTGVHVFFKQMLGNLPVEGGEVSVHFDRQGHVRLVANDSVEIPQAARIAAPANANRAISAATALFARARFKYSPQALPVAYRDPSRGLVSAWKVNLVLKSPSGDWSVYVDGNTGAVLKVLSRSQQANGKAKVFNPDPVTTSGNFGLADNDGADSPVLDAQLFPVALADLDGSGSLTGTYVTTAPTTTQTRAQEPSLNFFYDRSDDRFDEVMVYFHVDQMQHYIQSLGFNNINNRQIGVDVNGQEDDNSHYSPLDHQITFGKGGVHDAQDATIIYHESGHAIQDNQVPGFGETAEGGAMGEGFGDYWAGSNFAQGNKFDVFIGKWDGVAYNPAKDGNPAFLRRLDSPKQYPADIQGEVHADGEIWSACLWQIRTQLGREKADRLILESHFRLTPSAVFEDGANALVDVAGELFGDAAKSAVTQVFTARGILK